MKTKMNIQSCPLKKTFALKVMDQDKIKNEYLAFITLVIQYIVKYLIHIFTLLISFPHLYPLSLASFEIPL